MGTLLVEQSGFGAHSVWGHLAAFRVVEAPSAHLAPGVCQPWMKAVHKHLGEEEGKYS